MYIYIYMPMELFVSFAADLATIGGSLVVVTPVWSPPVPSVFVYVVLGNSKLFLPWRFPCALAEWSSGEGVLVAGCREWDARYTDTYWTGA
jgi:hypothetical protein